MKDKIIEILKKSHGLNKASFLADEIMELLPKNIEGDWVVSNTQMRKIIVDVIVPQVVRLWLKKNEDYAGQQVLLGEKAQFCDINRKYWKLKQAMWDGVPPQFESVSEICMDMIGHLLMTIYMEGTRPSPEIRDVRDVSLDQLWRARPNG